MNAERKDVLRHKVYIAAIVRHLLFDLQVLPALLALTDVIDQRLSQEILTKESAAML